MNEARDTRIDRLAETYSPSWHDRLSDWVDRRKLPNWLIYLSFPVIWTLLGILVQQLEGSGTIRDWDLTFLIAIAQTGYILFVAQFLDKLALNALKYFRPALNIDEAQFPGLQQLISTLPARKTLIATSLFGTVGIGAILVGVSETNGASSAAQQGALFGIWLSITFLAVWAANGLFVYHTVHQLGVVNFIYTHLTIVHPFHQRELFALSGFSAQTGIAIVLITPLWIIFDPGVTSLGFGAVFALFGFIAFYSPLVGIHKILAKEKDRLADDNAREMERAIEGLMSELGADRLEGLAQIDQKLTTLTKARAQIDAISTWPWGAGTLRQIIGAISLPLVVWLIQYFLAQALTR